MRHRICGGIIREDWDRPAVVPYTGSDGTIGTHRYPTLRCTKCDEVILSDDEIKTDVPSIQTR